MKYLGKYEKSIRYGSVLATLLITTGLESVTGEIRILTTVFLFSIIILSRQIYVVLGSLFLP